MQSYYTSQLKMPFLLFFLQNSDVDIIKTSDMVQVGNVITSSYVVVSLILCITFLPHIMLVKRQFNFSGPVSYIPLNSGRSHNFLRHNPCQQPV